MRKGERSATIHDVITQFIVVCLVSVHLLDVV